MALAQSMRLSCPMGRCEQPPTEYRVEQGSERRHPRREQYHRFKTGGDGIVATHHRSLGR